MYRFVFLIYISFCNSSTTAATIAHNTSKPRVTTAFNSNRDFSIYEISFYWYKLIGVLLVWIFAIPLSYIWKRDDNEKQNPKMYCSLVRKFLNSDRSSNEEEPLRVTKSNQ